MWDVIDNVSETRINVLDKGFIRLVDVMPRLVPDDQKTADFAIVQSARVSYGEGTKTVNEDRGLIRYLMRHSHTTPFEMVEFKFHAKMPIFIARQWIRHRTANVNEVSGRYSVMKDEFYLPDEENVRQQSQKNKQGGDQVMEALDAKEFLDYVEKQCEDSYNFYTKMIERGVSREQARMVLPPNLYTEWFWKCDLHNLFHFLALRCDSHAQWEIRAYADAMLRLIQPIVPWAVEAWNDYHPLRGAMKLSRLEVSALKELINKNFVETDWVARFGNKREAEEFLDKLKELTYFG